MGSVWDDLGETAKGKLSPYTHIKELFQTLECHPGNAQQREIGNKLTEALTERDPILHKVAIGVNDDFARKLDRPLADPATRERIARLYREDPAALDRAMDQITAHAENTAAIVNNIPLKSDQVTRSPAPANGPPAAAEKPVPQKRPDQPAATPGKGDPTHEALVDALGGRQEVCKMQAQLHLLGYAGQVDGSDLGALDAYMRKNNLRPAEGGVYDDFLRETKARIDKEWNGWAKNQDNVEHLKDIVNTGYNVGVGRPPNDAVKEMQIAMLAMGGPLPRFGADGIRGHETNGALRGLMTPGGAYTRILDAVGIPHEWPSARQPAAEKPDGTPKVTRDNVLTGTPSGMASYFTSQSRQNSGHEDAILAENQDALHHPVTRPGPNRMLKKSLTALLVETKARLYVSAYARNRYPAEFDVQLPVTGRARTSEPSAAADSADGR